MRLWIVLAAFWALIVGGVALVQNEPFDGDYGKMYTFFFLAWAVPSGVALGLIYAARWVAKGFKGPGQST